jgi:hypothetical protein
MATPAKTPVKGATAKAEEDPKSNPYVELSKHVVDMPLTAQQLPAAEQAEEEKKLAEEKQAKLDEERFATSSGGEQLKSEAEKEAEKIAEETAQEPRGSRRLADEQAAGKKAVEAKTSNAAREKNPDSQQNR